jgi:hypothetical protein
MSLIDDLIERMRGLEEEVQAQYDKNRQHFKLVIEQKRIQFGQDVLELQRRSKRGVLRYVFGASPIEWLAVPVIWLGIVPMLLLDLFLFLFQTVCFPAYKIPKVKRSAYLALDRGDLPYLNLIEKLNCAYCGYANGLAGYFREIAARTEQYWCPIKHARRIVAAHDYYPNFFEHGDAEAYRLGLERLRSALAELGENA